MPALALALLGPSAAAAAGTVEPRLTYRPELPALHPNLARGYELDRSFDVHGFSYVNLFNGNLFLSLPIGLHYPLSGAFGYQLRMTYNSKVWDYQPVQVQGYQPGQGQAESRPLAWSNAGLGFDLSLGRLLAPLSPGNPTGQWLYGGFDGSPHLLYSTLHHDIAEPDDPNDDRLYSRDGTYLRLRRISASERRLERPDGVVAVFQLQGSEWRLVRQFRSGDEGSDLTVSYEASRWTLTDAHGRVHVVTFRDDPSGAYPRLVDTVELAAFGGARALYTFDYAWTTVPRACDDHRGGEVTVPLLTAITDPAGQTRAFSYYGAGDCATSGRIQRAQWAAGGHWQWTYRRYEFPPSHCSGGTTAAYFRSEIGVASRSMVLPDGTVQGAWTYDPVLTDPGSQCGAWRFKNTVTAPDGDRTVHHFSVANALSATGSPADYALPLTRETTDPTGTRYLSTETHDCGSGGSCTLLRSTYVAWAQDRSCTTLTGEFTDTNRRQYAVRTLFHDDLDNAGAPRFLDVTQNDFDGLGHYRIETRTNNFGRAEFYQVTTGYNAGAGSYPGSFTMPAGGAPWHLGRYTHHRLNDGLDTSRRDACFDAHGRLLRERWRNGNGEVTTAKDVVKAYAWDGWNRVDEADYGGDLQALPTGTGLCAITLPDTAQYLVRRTYQAGTLATENDFDPDAGKALPFARLDQDVDADSGLIATRRDVAGIATALEHDLLGRLTWKRPEAGQGAWVQHAHTPPTGGSGWWEGPKTITYRRPSGSGSPLATETVWLDVFGRRAAEEVTLPGGTKSRRRFLYDAVGREVATSVRFDPDVGGTVRWHQRLDLDPFGRPRRLRPPEGADHDQVLTYVGIREQQRTADAGRWYSPAGFCMESPVTYVTTYDGNGRVWKEVEDRPQPAPSLLVERERRYDLAGRLAFTSVLETVGGTVTSNWSSQTWDERGFLVEVRSFDTSGQQSRRLEYEEHDARGNPGLRIRFGYGSPAGGISVRTTYDAAGRTVSIADASDPTKLWKTFVYGDDNAPGDARRGKLVTARRFNHTIAGGTFVVDNAYVYGGLGGLISKGTLTIERTVGTPLLRRYRTEVEYDELAWTRTVHYPQCLACPGGEPALARAVTIDRSGDLVTAVHGTLDGAPESWVAGVAYGVSGLPATVEHGNGVSETFAPDPHGWGRASAIQVQGAHVQEDSGAIVYDGEGRLCGTGANSNVPVRHETPPMLPSEIPCLDAATVDPFDRLTDEIRDPECRDDAPPPLRLYDAADRLVGVIDTRARKKVLIGGQWQWMNDPDRWTRTWIVPGIDGATVRRIEESYVGGAWRSTTDIVHELGRDIAMQRHEITPTGYTLVTTRHRHPIGRPTDENGLPRVNQ